MPNAHSCRTTRSSSWHPQHHPQLGTIEAGKTAQQVLNLKIVKTEWNRDNMKVMVIASRKGDNNKMDVVNVVICDINDTVSYNYNK